MMILLLIQIPNFLFRFYIHLSMNAKKLLTIFIALILPWIILAIAILKPIYNAWLYVGSITWFLTALFITLSFYKF